MENGQGPVSYKLHRLDDDESLLVSTIPGEAHPFEFGIPNPGPNPLTGTEAEAGVSMSRPAPTVWYVTPVFWPATLSSSAFFRGTGGQESRALSP